MTLHAFGGFVAAAVLVGCWLVLRRAENKGLNAAHTRNLLLWMVGLGFVGSHLEHLTYYEPWVLAKPFAYPLRLLNLGSGMSSFGGILGGVAGGLPSGFSLFLLAALYGSARLLLDQLRDDKRFLGLTSGRYGAMAGLTGLAMLRVLAATNEAPGPFQQQRPRLRNASP